MRMSLPSRAYGFALALLSILACALYALALPAGAHAAEACPNEQVRQESNVNPSTGGPYDTGLSDCRAYEMVSPANKEDHDVETLQSPPVAPDGEAIEYAFHGLLAEDEGGVALFDNPSLAVRGSSGWSSRSDYLPASIAPEVFGAGSTLSPDLATRVSCGVDGEGVEYLEQLMVCAVREPDGSWEVSPAFGDTGSGGLELERFGASKDLSRLFFTFKAGGRLLQADTETGTLPGPFNGSGIYELAGLGTGGPVTLRLVNIDSNGVEIGNAPAKLGNVDGLNLTPGTDYHAVSESGETVYFETGLNTVSNEIEDRLTLYARVGGAYTIDISEPSAIDCSECQTAGSLQKKAEFQGASADGSKVFFTTAQELLPGHSTNNIYEYNFDAPAGHRVTLVSVGSSKSEVLGVVGTSNEGSHVYFVAKSALTSTPNAEGQEAQTGGDNLYVYERNSQHPAGRLTFVTLLCSGTGLSGTASDSQCLSPSSDASLWTTIAGGAPVSLTPSGDYLVFDSYAHLLPEDKNEAQAVYRYDAETGEMSWISHGAFDFKGQCEAEKPTLAEKKTCENESDAATIPVLNHEFSGAFPDVNDINRVLSDDGEYVVFSTKEELQADDKNKEKDVYLWHDGTVSLISDGQAKEAGTPSMSASGSDVFFTTRTELVGQDSDENIDMYDARIDGGFPAPPPVVTECGLREAGEACQGAAAQASVFGAPGSATFTGGVNIAAAGGSGAKPPATAPKSLTRAQKLAAAMKACKKLAKKKRATCEVSVRKKYGVKAKGKSKAKAKTKRSNRRGK